MLTWDDSYAIALALQGCFPDAELEKISLDRIYRWTIELPGFDDDPDLANEIILTDILREWVDLPGSIAS